MERTHVGHHHACHDIPDNGRRTERHDKTHENGNALEDSRVGIRQQRPYHHQHQRIAQHAQNVIGGLCPVGIESAQFQTPRLNLACKVLQSAHQIAEAEVDDDNLEDIRQVTQHRAEDVLHRIPDIAEDRERERARLWEQREKYRHRDEQLNANNNELQEFIDKHAGNLLTMDIKELVVLPAYRFQGSREFAHHPEPPFRKQLARQLDKPHLHSNKQQRQQETPQLALQAIGLMKLMDFLLNG